MVLQIKQNIIILFQTEKNSLNQKVHNLNLKNFKILYIYKIKDNKQNKVKHFREFYQEK